MRPALLPITPQAKVLMSSDLGSIYAFPRVFAALRGLAPGGQLCRQAILRSSSERWLIYFDLGNRFRGCFRLAQLLRRSKVTPVMRWFLFLIVAAHTACALDVRSLDQIPIQEAGRKKPFLVFAQESLLGLSGKTSLTIDGTKMDARQVIASLWLAPQGWDQKPIILVNHKPLKEATELDTSRKLFSYRELAANEKLVKLLDEAQALRARPGNPKPTGLLKEAADVGFRMAEFESLVGGSAFRFIANSRAADAQWLPVLGTDEDVRALRQAFIAGDDGTFAREAEALRVKWAAVEPNFQPPAWKIQLETLYQKAHPFRWAWICYAAAGIVLLAFRASCRRLCRSVDPGRKWISAAGGGICRSHRHRWAPARHEHVRVGRMGGIRHDSFCADF